MLTILRYPLGGFQLGDSSQKSADYDSPRKEILVYVGIIRGLG